MNKTPLYCTLISNKAPGVIKDIDPAANHFAPNSLKQVLRACVGLSFAADRGFYPMWSCVFNSDIVT